MNDEYKWLRLDESYRFSYREDRLAQAKQMGFQFISECVVELYRRYKSSYKVGRMLGLHSDTILVELRRFNEPLMPKGSQKGHTRCKPIFSTDPEIQMVRKLYNKYRSTSKVGKILKVSASCVYQTLQREKNKN